MAILLKRRCHKVLQHYPLFTSPEFKNFQDKIIHEVSLSTAPELERLNNALPDIVAAINNCQNSQATSFKAQEKVLATLESMVSQSAAITQNLSREFIGFKAVCNQNIEMIKNVKVSLTFGNEKEMDSSEPNEKINTDDVTPFSQLIDEIPIIF